MIFSSTELSQVTQCLKLVIWQSLSMEVFLIDNQEIPEMEALRAKEYPDLPFHQPGGKQVQIFLSEYSLNTLMISSHI